MQFQDPLTNTITMQHNHVMRYKVVITSEFRLENSTIGSNCVTAENKSAVWT